MQFSIPWVSMWHSFKPHQSRLSIEEKEIVFSIIHQNIRHPYHCFSPQIWWNSQQKLPFSTPLQFSGATQTLPYIFLHSLEIFWFILYFIVVMYRITIWGSTILSSMTKKQIRKEIKKYIFTFMTENFGFPNIQRGRVWDL